MPYHQHTLTTHRLRITSISLLWLLLSSYAIYSVWLTLETGIQIQGRGQRLPGGKGKKLQEGGVVRGAGVWNLIPASSHAAQKNERAISNGHSPISEDSLDRLPASLLCRDPLASLCPCICSRRS